MKNKCLQFVNGLLAVVITFLGFSCEDAPDMYGMPPVVYSVKGKVVNNQKEPVGGIKLIIKDIDADYITQGDTIYSWDTGEFRHQSYIGEASGKLKIIYRDLRNKEIVYKTDSIIVDKTNSEEVIIELTKKSE